GSNGKTTTTNLVYHVLKKAGLSVAMAGNMGTSLSRRLLEEEKEYYVLELSSFQLEDMFETKIDIAILLNIVEDHLDRYHYDIEEYGRAKMRILQNQSAHEVFIYNAD